MDCLLDDNILPTTGARSIAAPSPAAHLASYSITESSDTAPCVSPSQHEARASDISCTCFGGSSLGSSLSLSLSCSHGNGNGYGRASTSSYATVRVVPLVMPSACLAAGGLAASRRGPCPSSSPFSLLFLLLLLLASQAHVAAAMRPARIAQLRQEAVDMFYHGFDNYMSVAFPEDEVGL